MPLADIVANFLGIYPQAPESSRMGKTGNARVLVAPSIPVGGVNAISGTTEQRSPLPVTDLQAGRAETLNLLETAAASAGAEKPKTNDAPAPIPVAPPVNSGVALAPVYAMAAANISNLGASISEKIAAQNSRLAEALVSRDTVTDGGKKIVTEKYSLTPSVAIADQRLVSQQTDTRNKVKTVKQVYSA